MLDVSSLKKAIDLCDEVLKQLENHPNDDIIQAATIQRFEYTYSLTISLLTRFLGEILPENEIIDTHGENPWSCGCRWRPYSSMRS